MSETTRAERLAAALESIRRLEEATARIADGVDLLRRRVAVARLEISQILTEDRR